MCISSKGGLMKRIHLFMVFTLLCLAFGSLAFASTEQAEYQWLTVFVDGSYQPLEAYKINGSNYFKLRDLAYALDETPSGFDLVWHAERKQIEIKKRTERQAPLEASKGSYNWRYGKIKAVLNTAPILVDGLPEAVTAYVIEGSTYFNLRDMGRLFEVDVKWVPEENAIYLSTKAPIGATKTSIKPTASLRPLSSYYSRWHDVMSTYLFEDESGQLVLLEADEQVVIKTLDASFRVKNQKKLPMELPIFGGFFSGEKYHFIVFGNTNHEENDQKEVIRVVKYDKAFKRLGSVSIRGGESYTVVPFDAGSLRMAEEGNQLVVHTARLRYLTPDGLNHQSQLTLLIDTHQMKATNYLGAFQANHVSHSFDQYAAFDAGNLVLLDHGDAYPRSVALSKSNGNERFTSIDLFKIPGLIGANQTGVSLGGFEVSKTHYLVAMNTLDHDRVTFYDSFDMGIALDQRDVIIASLAKNQNSGFATKHIVHGKYIDTNRFGSVPRLVKITEDRFLLLWEEFLAVKDKAPISLGVQSVWVDASGHPVSQQTFYPFFKLSYMQPILHGNAIVWAGAKGDILQFYQIPVE